MQSNSSKTKSKSVWQVPCIFVHAGAGYHSVQNEHVHIQACADATRVAMTLLRAGGCAVDAVELAIKVLEDREPTNAGYGSNLAMDGVVECDAVIIDHHGRSGGVGAVAQVKNPISLARLLLSHSSKALTLRRVPPNFLVGQGATDFAHEHGLRILPHNMLISPGARDRWTKWKIDLQIAERREKMELAMQHNVSPSPSEPDEDPLRQYAEQEQHRRAHTSALQQALFNEAQPASPPPTSFKTPAPPDIVTPISKKRKSSQIEQHQYLDPRGPATSIDMASSSPFMNSTQCVLEGSKSDVEDDGADLPDYEDMVENSTNTTNQHTLGRANDATSEMDASNKVGSDQVSNVSDAVYVDVPRGPVTQLADLAIMKQDLERQDLGQLESTELEREELEPEDLDLDNRLDDITDTVGAIAIDCYGNMACGASSGGIGMKHRGRVGPAALVSIGASLIPADTADTSRTSVASVTSGTGEHMATTLAASTCSTRVMNSQRRGANGLVEDVNEDEAIRGFVQHDFMGHPSLTHTWSTGAIGVLSVKKSKDGCWMYFAHNTESFVIANMCGYDEKPSVAMSRLKSGGNIAQGGRAVRFSTKKSRS